MALIEDLNIRLIADGNMVDYEDVRQIKVPLAEGGYGLFTHMKSLRSYFIKPTDTEDMYLVMGMASLSAGGIGVGNAAIVFFDQNDFGSDVSFIPTNGTEWRTCVILTPKILTVGETYHVNDL